MIVVVEDSEKNEYMTRAKYVYSSRRQKGFHLFFSFFLFPSFCFKNEEYNPSTFGEISRLEERGGRRGGGGDGKKREKIEEKKKSSTDLHSDAGASIHYTYTRAQHRLTHKHTSTHKYTRKYIHIHTADSLSLSVSRFISEQRWPELA